MVYRIIYPGVLQFLWDYFMVIGYQNHQKHFTNCPLQFMPPLSTPTSLFIIHSGTFQTTSSKEAKPLHRSWKERRKLCRSRPRRKERPSTGRFTLPLRLIACGCACMPSWVSCVSTHGLLCAKALGRHCSPPSLPTGPCCNSQHGILWSGR